MKLEKASEKTDGQQIFLEEISFLHYFIQFY